MAMDRLTDKLVFILHADVAGSTQLVRQDEHLAHERIQDSFGRFKDFIEKYRGRMLELRGDALLAEFERASDAVTATLAFQSDQADYLSRLKDELKPGIRVGIAMGEVVIADGTVTGAGVVLAQRVEQLAEPGSLCITAALHEALPDRMPFNLENMGDQMLKGFDDPVRVYRVKLNPSASIPLPPQESQHKPSQKSWKLGIVITLIVIAIAIGITYLFKPVTLMDEPASNERMAFPLPDKPSIAVLPFTNMSDDPKQEYFVDGMTEDLITDLSQLSGLFVIARNSVFTYKDKLTSASQVAEELGVRYVLEGSVRRAGNQLRINAQLIDATTGGHLWAERYDGSLINVFELQDQVTNRIVTALAINLTSQEKTNTITIETNNPEAYDIFLKGWTHYRRQTPKDFSIARDYFERAIALDSNYSRAYAALSILYWETHLREWQPALKLDRILVKQNAFKYRDLAMANPTPLALVVASDMLMWRGQHDAAIIQAKRAIKLSQNDAYSHLKLGEILAYAGFPLESLKSVALASRLDPHGKPRQLYVQGLAEFGLKEFSKASASLEQALALNPDFAKPITILAASNGHLGLKDAASILKPYESEYWASAVSTALVQFPYSREDDKIRLAEGLRKGGLKEFD
jgi:adenylate cyclase